MRLDAGTPYASDRGRAFSRWLRSSNSASTEEVHGNMTTQDDEPKRRRLTRDDWVEAATHRLVKRSIDAVRVEPLAADLNVSRGSFYWHFKSRGELLTAILTNWQERQTRRIVDRIRQDRLLSPVEQLTRLRHLPPRTKSTKEAAALELAIRAWARRDSLARRVVDAVDAERIEFTKSLILDAGAAEQEAGYWSYIGYAYTLGESLLRDGMTDDQIKECRARLLQAQSATFADKRKNAKAQSSSK
jgi:AcrR family transcriptional regulator